MFGIGLRHQHFAHLLQTLEVSPQAIKVDWFEGITENFFDTEGRPIQVLERIRRDFPVGLHGVSLSIASDEELDFDYLKKVKKLYDRIDPFITSDHFCWTGKKNSNLHNLLPVSYTNETMDLLIPKIQAVQDFLKRPLALENLSAYFGLKNADYTEWDFLRILAERAGCKLLLDLNNVYVNSVNQKFDPYTYVNSIPDNLISEIHLAGFTDMKTHLFDTHSCAVWPAVWELYQSRMKSGLKVPVLVEWDEDIPEFEVVEAEAMKAKSLAGNQ
jgi:uncharacterized protein